jgi:hypothetical protein
MLLVPVVLTALLAACGSDAASAGDDAPPVDGATADGLPDGWKNLMQGNWNLAPGEEGYFCVYVTIPADVYVKSFRPLSPPGTHHSVLTRYTGASPADGTVRCGVGTNGQSMIYGSGVGAPDFEFPAGIGLHLTAGTRLLLNLHLYNATDVPLAGTSGALFQEATAAEIQHLAELVLAGPTIGLNVPTGTSTQTGTCQVNSITSEPIQVFALSQHMHKLGTHMRSTVRRGTTDIMLQDIAYDFEQQEFHHTSSLIELRPGDTLKTECTYNNTTGAAVRFGESSDDEMCFTDLFYYPAQGASYICSF